MTALLTQAAIEAAILTISDRLEDETHVYSQLSDEAAQAETAYKLKAARIQVGAAQSSTKITVAERAARIEVACGDELTAWKLLEAQRQACRESLLTLRARLDAFRTLAANVRHQT